VDNPTKDGPPIEYPDIVNFELLDDMRIEQFKLSPFENLEGAATRKFKFESWPTRPGNLEHVIFCRL
jgi:hypothetical protein